MMGMRTMEATVWETKVATVSANRMMHSKDSHGCPRGSILMIESEMYCSKPEEATAFPSTLPPARRKSVCQDNELKST